MKKYAVIVAGGSGLRMQSNLPKQFLLLNGEPVLLYTLRAFLQAYEDLTIVLVLSASYLETGRTMVAAAGATNRVLFTTGGETRFHSVKNGLALVEDPSIVFVHDGVRCLVSPALIHRCYEKAMETGNAIPAIACTDSVRVARGEHNQAIDRDSLRIIQTPQTFRSNIIKTAFRQDHHPDFTDEASVVERSGIAIQLVQGEDSNIKITRPMDLLIAEKILAERSGRLQ